MHGCAERNSSRQTERENEYKDKRDRQTECVMLSCVGGVSVFLCLTFLLPSVTVRGTGMGGHLLRWGGGFSLFHRMMIYRAVFTHPG